MSMSDNPEALRRLWPIIEKAVGGLVFTADKAGEVAADMATVRAALAQQAATPPASARERSPWEALFWTVAKELNCLPSSFVDANDHVIRKAREYAAAAARQAATPAPAEPVAWLYRVGSAIYLHRERTDHYFSQDNGATFVKGEPLYAAPPATPAAQPAEQTEGFVQPVPDKCDRIVWRGNYYHLPL